MSQQKVALGKGLASLLPGAGAVGGAIPPLTPPQFDHVNKDRHPGISLAGVDEISVNPYQPRREFDDAALMELAQSIESNGVIQPLVVRKTASGYQLIAGERRLRASRLAGLKQVPIVIRRSTDRESLELALIENIQRQDLNCVDSALAYAQLANDFSLTQEEISKRVGKDRGTVANHLRLLKLPEEIIESLKSTALSFGHAKVLMGLDDRTLLLKAHEEVVASGLSVRETEELINHLKAALPVTNNLDKDANKVQLSPARTRLLNLATELTRQLATKVLIKGGEKKGKIVLHYSSRQDLERVIAFLRGDTHWQDHPKT